MNEEIEKKDIRKTVVSSLSWVGLTTLSTQLVTFGVTIFVIRLLSPNDLGLMAISMIFFGFFMLVGELGLGYSIIQKSQLSYKEIQQILGIVILGSICFFLILFSGSSIIADFFSESRITSMLRALSFIFLLRPFYIIPESFLIKRMNFKKKSAVDACANLSGCFTALIMALHGFGVWSLVVGQISMHLIKSVGFNIALRMYVRPSFKFKGIGDSISFGGFVFGTRFFRFLFSKADMMVGGKFLGSGPLGTYAVAMQISTMLLEKLSLVIPPVAFPTFSIIKSDRRLVSSHFLKGLRFLNLLSIPCFVGIALLAPEITTLFLGSRWVGVVIPLQILCAVMPMRMFDILYYPLMNGMGRADINMVTSALVSVVMSAAFLVGQKWALEGLCWAWLFGYPIVFFFMIKRCAKFLELTTLSLLKTYFIPIIGSISMALVVILLRRELNGQISPWLQMVLLMVAGGTAFVTTTVLIFGNEVIVETKKFLRTQS